MEVWLLIEIVITLFVMVNPIGVIAPYLAMTKEMKRDKQKEMLTQAITFALIILILCVFIGRGILSVLGIDTFALQIAGGILFFKFGYEVMNGSVSTQSDTSPGLVPLGFPMIAGPGSITAIIVFSSQQVGTNWYLVLAITIVLALTYTIIYHSRNINRVMGDNATIAVVKIMGLFIITLGIQLILTGIQNWINSAKLIFV